MPGTPITANEQQAMSDIIYLASQSPRRARLLEQLGVRFTLLLPAADEDAEALERPIPNEPPRDYVQRVTALKLDAALARRQRLGWAEAPILCADTTVALGDALLGKPVDATAAAQMLARLAGRTHEVFTAVELAWADGRAARLSASHVSFSALTPAQVERYVASGEPMGKAGAYAIQGRAAAFVEHIAGSHSGIMGLPLFETAQLLRGAGWAL